MTEPALDFDELERWALEYHETNSTVARIKMADAFATALPVLIAEVKRLRAELDAEKGKSRRNIAHLMSWGS